MPVDAFFPTTGEAHLSPRRLRNMPDKQERILYENRAFRLTTRRLVQPGLEAVLTSPDRLRITRGGETREVSIPAPSPKAVRYRGSIPVLMAMYHLAMEELQLNVSPSGLMLAGASWSTVWTRDIAYAAALGAALASPKACRSSLLSRVREGVILQDTGTGGGWPVSTDRVSWALGAWALYLSQGDRAWLEESVAVLTATLEQDRAVLRRRNGLIPGETSFLDWREQSYPDWMTPAEIGSSCAFGTNVLHGICRHLLSRMLRELGREKEADACAAEATELARAIEEGFWSRANRRYGMMRTEDGCLDERTDALATALAVISGLAGEHAEQALNSLPRSPWGTPVFAPFKAGQKGTYHNRAIWPFVEAYVLLAHAERQDVHGAERSMVSLLRAAMAFGTNKENFSAATGEAEDTIQNSDRQLWSVAGMLGLFYYGLFGIQYEHDNLVLSPCVPRSFAGSHWLTGLRLREMVLDIHLNGYGTDVCSVMINGKPGSPVIPLTTRGRVQVELELMPMDELPAASEYPEAVEDLPEPCWDEPTPELLRWHPVEGATSYCLYADGVAFANTAACSHWVAHAGGFYHAYRVQALNAETSSCLSRPYECVAPGARQLLQPFRIGEEAEYEVEHRQAWLDTRPCTSRLDYEPATLAAGVYRIRVCYCNAMASRRDGDTCALRELMVNGRSAGVIPLPHNTEAGQWDDYTLTAPLTVELPGGIHRFSLRYTEICENANRDVNQCMVRFLEITRLL